MSKKYNLENQKFGKLTVLHKTNNPNNKKKSIFWLCKCECGNETIVPTTSLLSGKSIQCKECGIKASGKSKRKDVIGKKFGKLTIISISYEKDNNNKTRKFCKCICDCGNIVIRKYDDLTKSETPSCGCAKREIVIKSCGTNVDGQKFGRLTVLETMWDETPIRLRCKCDCGNEYIGVKRDICSGHTQSCGCLHSEAISISNTKDWTGTISDFGIMFLSPHSLNDTGQWLWNCKCGICGNIFVAMPAKVNNGHITSCGCRRKSSREEMIENFLIENKLKYVSEYSFNDCIHKYKLRFDFAIFKDDDLAFLIEYQGQQHYKIIELFGGQEEYKKSITRDKIKKDYCKIHNIRLLELPYYLSIDEIKEKILTESVETVIPVIVI